MRTNGIGDTTHVPDSVLPRESGPSGIRGTRRGDRGLHVFAVAFLERAQRDACVDRAAIVELRIRFEVLTVDVKKMLEPERLWRAGDGRIQLAMKVFEGVPPERRVCDFGCHEILGQG